MRIYQVQKVGQNLRKQLQENIAWDSLVQCQGRGSEQPAPLCVFIKSQAEVNQTHLLLGSWESKTPAIRSLAVGCRTSDHDSSNDGIPK
jgi:hypothetical protein